MKRKNTAKDKIDSLQTAGDVFGEFGLPKEYLYEYAKDEELERFGISKGDCLVLFPTREIIEGQITFIKDDGYWDLGFANDCFGDINIDRGGGDYTNYTFSKRKIIKMGVLVGIMRRFHLEEEAKEKVADDAEITAVCEQCKTSLTGKPEFIRAMGWRLRKDSAECVRCW